MLANTPDYHNSRKIKGTIKRNYCSVNMLGLAGLFTLGLVRKVTIWEPPKYNQKLLTNTIIILYTNSNWEIPITGENKMGTRADFYVGMGEKMEWLGSIAWDGYPDGLPEDLRLARSKERYRKELEDFFIERDDVTRPEMGWPWPWDDSGTTDYAYTFHDGKVSASCFGSDWFDPANEDYPETRGAVFPDMSDVKNVDFGKRSGLIIISARGENTND